MDGYFYQVKWKQLIDDYFVFSKKERVGIYVLSTITLLVWLVPYFFSKDEKIEDVFEISYVQIDSAEKLLLSKSQHYKQRETKTVFFTDERSVGDSLINRNAAFSYKANYSYKKKLQHVIDINKADSSQFEQLPAIGIKLSSRIVRYRDRLGGFWQTEQLKEVYGLSDSTYNVILPYLKVETGFILKKIAINKFDYATLRRHPYMDHEFIKMVLAYRKSHGNYKDKTDFEKMIQLDRSKLEKIIPYLSFED